MKALFGLLLILGGIALGLYVGLYLCIYGGIMNLVDVFNTFNTTQVLNGAGLAIGVIKIMCAGVCGALSAYVLIIPGVTLIFKN